MAGTTCKLRGILCSLLFFITALRPDATLGDDDPIRSLYTFWAENVLAIDNYDVIVRETALRTPLNAEESDLHPETEIKRISRMMFDRNNSRAFFVQWELLTPSSDSPLSKYLAMPGRNPVWRYCWYADQQFTSGYYPRFEAPTKQRESFDFLLCISKALSVDSATMVHFRRNYLGSFRDTFLGHPWSKENASSRILGDGSLVLTKRLSKINDKAFTSIFVDNDTQMPMRRIETTVIRDRTVQKLDLEIKIEDSDGIFRVKEANFKELAYGPSYRFLTDRFQQDEQKHRAAILVMDDGQATFEWRDMNAAKLEIPPYERFSERLSAWWEFLQLNADETAIDKQRELSLYEAEQNKMKSKMKPSQTK